MVPGISPRKCRDCGVLPGRQHNGGCAVEQCMLCGGQLLTCDCVYRVAGFDPASLPREVAENDPTDAMSAAYDAAVARLGGPDVWTGEWPGTAECVAFGWYARLNPHGPGWVPCARDAEGAAPDVGRLSTEASWDRAQRRFVRRS